MESSDDEGAAGEKTVENANRKNGSGSEGKKKKEIMIILKNNKNKEKITDNKKALDSLMKQATCHINDDCKRRTKSITISLERNASQAATPLDSVHLPLLNGLRLFNVFSGKFSFFAEDF